jgi:adenylate cyclase
METYDLVEAAGRAGLTVDELTRLVELRILAPDDAGRFTRGDLRRVALVSSLAASGIPLDGLAAAIGSGQVSLGFLDAPAFDRFSALSGSTFAEVAERIGTPVEQLLFVREATGSMAARPEDRIREEELAYADLIEGAAVAGLRPLATQQMIRSQGEGLRRIAETESAIWQSDVIEPAMQKGMRPDQILGVDVGDRMSVLTERAVVAMYHLQQARAWTANLIEGVEWQLAQAGLHTRLAHPPAMCFLDISGFTRLTQERGDMAAAELAGQLGRIVQRASVEHGGRPVKWLGDGVMLHFPNPGGAVVGALEMLRALADGGLPPAHVGLHAGPVIFQEGDYYGSTVNIASRIADHAVPGQVLVSREVVDEADGAAVVFRPVGAIELKGVAGAMPLFEAASAGSPG